jgi:CDP-diacylglycerol---glycerol-3-phosphate 3-phosphatidyltransferase
MAANNFPKEVQEWGLRYFRPLIRPLIRRGVDPNHVTTLGFLVTVAAGLVFFTGHVRIAGALVLIGGILDIVDGEVARGTGRTSVFGSFYDATLDRISEVVMFLGILSLYAGGHPDFPYPWMVYVVGLALSGSLVVSYIRARAEALGLNCSVGMMQRMERVALIGLAALLFGGTMGGAVLTGLLIVMATLTNVTVVQRIVWVYRHTRPDPVTEPVLASRRPFKVTSKRRIGNS